MKKVKEQVHEAPTNVNTEYCIVGHDERQERLIETDLKRAIKDYRINPSVMAENVSPYDIQRLEAFGDNVPLRLRLLSINMHHITSALLEYFSSYGSKSMNFLELTMSTTALIASLGMDYSARIFKNRPISRHFKRIHDAANSFCNTSALLIAEEDVFGLMEDIDLLSEMEEYYDDFAPYKDLMAACVERFGFWLTSLKTCADRGDLDTVKMMESGMGSFEIADLYVERNGLAACKSPSIGNN